MNDKQSYVFQYGLRPPTLNAEMVNEHIFEAHVLYNKMIAVERDRIQAIMDLEASQGDVAGLRQEIESRRERLGDIRKEIKALRGSKPAGDDAKKTHRDKITDLQVEGQNEKKRIDELRASIKEIRKSRKDDEYEAKKAAIFEECKKAHKTLYESKVVHWGTFNAVKSAVQQAVKKPGLPRFRRWDGEGQLTAQLQDKPSTSAVMGTEHGFFQIDPVDPKAWDTTVPKGQRKRLQRTKLRLRIGTVEGTQKPIFAEWPMILHRPLPSDAVVTGVSVNRRKYATRTDWTAQVCVQVPVAPVNQVVSKSVALDLGWRKLPNGDIRVAFWADSDEKTGEVRLPVSIQKRLGKADDIRSKRDETLNLLKEGLLEDLANRDSLSDELREHIQHMHMWRAAPKFVRLLHRYKEALPTPAVERLTTWYHRDRHLWQYEVGLRKGALGHRKAIYRNFAAGLVRDYNFIAIEDFHLPGVTKKPQPEKKAQISDDMAKRNNGASRQRTKAAPGMFRQDIINAATKKGVLTVEVNARSTTRTCVKCGCKEKWEDPSEQIHTCAGCGAIFDRDHNAAQNILARGLVLLQTPEALAKANLLKTQGKAKWAKWHEVATTPVVK